MGSSRPSRFDRWLDQAPRGDDERGDQFSATTAFLWLASATTLVLLMVVLTSR